MPILHIHLLGDFRLVYDGTPVTTIVQARQQALLAYLLLHRDSPQPRQRLAYLFWPDTTEAQARTNLRQLLHHLRRAWPAADQFLQIETKTVQWRPDADYTLDVTDFGQYLAQAAGAVKARDTTSERTALAAAVQHYGGELLPGCYDDWILPERERLSQAYLGALEHLILLTEEQRDYRSAIGHAECLLRQDPLHETTYRRLMRLHALHDDRASALRVYHICATLLERELGVAPNAYTQEAYHRLLNMEAPALLRAQRPLGAGTRPVMVGRQEEWDKLRSAWRGVTAGNAAFVLISGEAGIGKTRLAEEFLVWAARQGITTARTRSYAAEGQLAYAPVIELLRTDPLCTGLSRLEHVWLTELSRLLPELLEEQPALPKPDPISNNWQRQRLFEALARVVLNDKEPLSLLLDDVQWCDQDTLEWLHYLLRFGTKARLLFISTVRPEEVEQAHPLMPLLLDLRRQGQVREIELGPLDANDTRALAEQMANRKLDTDQVSRLYHHTEGNPLFVVEAIRAEANGGEANPGLMIPSPFALEKPPVFTKLPVKVQAVIQARLRRLSPSAREVAGLAATVGRAFTFPVLAQASDSSKDVLVQALDELWQRRILREQGENAYDFSHDKIREVAYAEMSQARRRLSHGRVAGALERVCAADLEPVSGQIASHYEQAGLPAKAIPYYQRAAEVAQQVYAHADAASHLSRGLKLLEQIPVTPECLQQELALQLALGVSLTALKGVSATPVKKVYVRAQTLAGQLGDEQQRLTILEGLYTSYLTQGQVQMACDLAEQMLSSAGQGSYWLATGHALLAIAVFHLGHWAASRDHLELEQQLLGQSDDPWFNSGSLRPAQHGGSASQRHLAVVLWHLGYPEQALQQMEETIALVQALEHPYSLAAALGWAAWLHQLRREPALAQTQAERAIVISQQQRFPYWLAHSRVIEGWALAQQGQVEAGIARMQEALAARLSMDAHLHQPALLAMMAETYGQAGQPELGLRLLDEALARAEATGEHCWDAELQRLQAELLWRQGTAGQAVEACFLQALALARQQEARTLELRTTVSLSRLWQRQGKEAAACQALAEIYDWFSEGFDTPDLRQARALLATLT